MHILRINFVVGFFCGVWKEQHFGRYTILLPICKDMTKGKCLDLCCSLPSHNDDLSNTFGKLTRSWQSSSQTHPHLLPTYLNFPLYHHNLPSDNYFWYEPCFIIKQDSCTLFLFFSNGNFACHFMSSPCCCDNCKILQSIKLLLDICHDTIWSFSGIGVSFVTKRMSNWWLLCNDFTPSLLANSTNSGDGRCTNGGWVERSWDGSLWTKDSPHCLERVTFFFRSLVRLAQLA